ncbi:MAG: RES family NAD+ phosphorylase [Actinobacteria bacterium]|nr:RES family NAD+ phosphorylase [Actinomycetota bacterium]
MATVAAQLQTQFAKRSDSCLLLYRARCAGAGQYTSADETRVTVRRAGKAAVPERGRSGLFLCRRGYTTALMEIRAESDEMVAIGEWVVRQPLVYADFVHDLARPSLFDPVGAKNRRHVQFLRDFVTRIRQPKDLDTGDANSYLATQVLSEFLRYELPTPWKTGVDAVRCPSSIHPGGVNWVIFGRPTEAPRLL